MKVTTINKPLSPKLYNSYSIITNTSKYSYKKNTEFMFKQWYIKRFFNCVIYCLRTLVTKLCCHGKISKHSNSLGPCGSVVVKALRCRSEGLGIDPQWCRWGFFFSEATDGTMCVGVDSASKNEYQENSCG
jgi:hypothetical protein